MNYFTDTRRKKIIFFYFYCISAAVTNKISYIAWQLEHSGIISFYI